MEENKNSLNLLYSCVKDELEVNIFKKMKKILKMKLESLKLI